MKQFSLLIITFLISSLSVFSQQIEVSGTISDESGGVMPGVNVKLVGTNVGTLSDFDGKYIINAEIGNKLQFSYVGMKTQTKEVTTSQLDVILFEDMLGLDEVIVTGTTGIATKRQLGSSITAVSSKDLSASKANVSIGEALQGQIAGARINRSSGDPSGGMSVILRGNSTVTGSSEPLYIIDGVIINNSSSSLLNLGGNTQNRLVDINPDDIEKIEILKGAAAAAIYGSRASNGVVQIFTKRGKTGEPNISYTASFNANSIREFLPYNDAQLEWDGDVAVPSTRYNYQDYIFKNSTGFQNDVNVSGSSDKTGYAFSLGQYNNEGIVRNTDFDRKSIRLRLDQKVYDWMDVSIGSYFSNSKSNDMPNGKNYGPITSLLFADNINDATPDEFGNYANIGWMANPNEAIDRVKAIQKYTRSISDVQFKLRPFEGLTVNYVFGIDKSNGEGTLYIPNGFNTKPNGVVENNTTSNLLYNSDFNIGYHFDISDNIESTTSVGYSYQYDKGNVFNVGNNAAGTVEAVQVTEFGSADSSYDFRSQRSMWGSFIQQSFDFKNHLFLTLAGRIDGASTFGQEHRNQFYPKLGLSYNISDAEFWELSKSVVGSLKLRTAWGQSGNLSALGAYDRFYNYSRADYNGNIGYYPFPVEGNPDLKPERQTEQEFGFDMTLLNNRIGLEFTYYNQDVTDLLLQRDLSPSTGYTSRFENIGSMTNKGFEILVKAKPVKGELGWDVSGTFSRNKNNLTHVEGGKMSIGFWGSSVAITDQPLGVFYGTFLARDDNGELLLDANGFVQRARGSYEPKELSDGEIIQVAVEEYDESGQPSGTILKKVVGDPNPDFVASLTNILDYKDFSFRIQFDMVQGNDVLSWDKRMNYLFKGGEATGLELQGELPKGSSSPKFGIWESFVEDGSFVKLREVAISYNIKIDKSYLQNIRLTASGNNLISWDNHWGFDPEVNTGGQTNGVTGQQMASVPIPRVYKLGVKFNF